ncbi:hypothetical protein TI39_contig375g00005 [Zymoseptoria brevis]|uniref:BTB domain-containing protein n=1 Tax=Zymoseptoria brevis TaxID=1047168 RepID=A0A0F4GNS1_9PEZI|nr:hypothetical protein TI39_contig375g00005 [Zymoseptoria brevis]
MAPAGGNSASALKHMFDTGEWSDLEVITASKTFKVHKSVVCQSLFFHAACTDRGFREAASGKIDLEESEDVVNAILCHLYEQPIVWLKQRYDYKTAEMIFPRGRDAVDLIVAADNLPQYDISGLAKEAYDKFISCIFCTDISPKHHIALGELFLAQVDAEPFRTDGRLAIAKSTNEIMKLIIKDRSLWNKLYANEAYVKLLLGYTPGAEPTQAAKRPRVTEDSD